MTLSTGVIGAGIVAGNNHFPAVARNPRTELAAVCDADEERAREATAEYGGRTYADAATMFAEEDLDWVHVATPVQSHFDLASTAVERGVPVTVQKPATRTLSELDDLAALADDRGVPVSVVYNWLYYPVVRRLRRRIRDGEFGDVRSVQVTVAGEGRPDDTYRGDWVFDLPGGDFEEGLPHPLYLTLALGGPPSDGVDVRTRSAGDYDEFDYDGVSLQYESVDGALCSTAVLSESTPSTQIRVYGTEGSATVDVPTASIDAHDAEEGPYHFPNERVRRGVRRSASALAGVASSLSEEAGARVEERFDYHRDDSADGHYYLFDRAARALERGDQPPVPLSRARQVLELTEAVRRSA